MGGVYYNEPAKVKLDGLSASQSYQVLETKLSAEIEEKGFCGWMVECRVWSLELDNRRLNS